MAGNLRTFAESQVEEETSAARAIVAEANRLVFLGFGFHRQNVELLTPATKTAINEFRSSVFGMSESNQREVLNYILTISKRAFGQADFSCLVKEKCGPFISAEEHFLSR
jgi:hypothetical protein